MTGVESTPVDSWTEVARSKLARILGPERAEILTRETLAGIGLSELGSPEDLLRFADELTKQGGFIEAVGRSLHVHAKLRGASDG